MPRVLTSDISAQAYYNQKARAFNELANTYNSNNPYKRWFFRNRAKSVLKALDLKKGENILDYGCGPGWYSREIIKAGCSVSCLDISSTYLDQAKEYTGSGASCYVSAVRDLPYSMTYDKILCTEVIEHVVDLSAHLTNFKNRLKPDGRLVLSTPNALSYMEKAYHDKKSAYEIDEHIRVWSEKDLRAALVTRGFIVESVSYCTYLVPYPWDRIAQILPRFVGPAMLSLAEKVLSKLSFMKKKGWTMIVVCKKA